MSSKPLIVSVCMITYNQEKYVEQAIKGVLNQKCDFDFEFIISNDNSSDNSNELILRIINDPPKGQKVIYTNQLENLGMISNFLWTIGKSTAKYIALCEGDDFWSDPYKLQKQVDFLEANPEFVICYHPVNVIFPDGKMEEDYLVKAIIEKSESNIIDMATVGNYIHTPSVIFRNVIKKYPESLKESPVGDFFLWMLLAQYGKIKKLADVMAVYRIGVGVHSTRDDKFRQTTLLKTLYLLSETIEDKSVVEILKNRITAIKSSSLPHTVRALEDFGDLDKGEVLQDFVSFGQLVKAIWLKIRRRF